MDNHIELAIQSADEDLRSMLIAQLAETGYDGFAETDGELKAYIPEDQYNETNINNLLRQYQLNYSISIIIKQNWNELWEAGFEPVLVNDFVGIRAGFHQPLAGVQHEIVITPKMSFGTGHHATTWQVMQLMGEMDFLGKSVLDFGTGTGILAILAEKLGATHIRAIDNDDWCIENASENISINNCKYIDIDKVDTAETNSRYDIVIANINRNIILDNIAFISDAIRPGGELILSGLLIYDENDILSVCSDYGIIHVKTIEKAGWIASRFYKKL